MVFINKNTSTLKKSSIIIYTGDSIQTRNFIQGFTMPDIDCLNSKFLKKLIDLYPNVLQNTLAVDIISRFKKQRKSRK